MPVYTPKLTGIKATVLTPFYYHGLYARDGSATDANIITDTALVFALRNTLLAPPNVLSAKPDYLKQLKTLPWRASLLVGTRNTTLAPIRHTIDVEREGGYHENMQKNMGSGNFKKTFFVHETAVNSTYSGCLYGADPFEITQQESLVIRVGVSRLGMVKLTREQVPEVQLNLATAHLFNTQNNQLLEAYRVMDTIRVSQPISLANAGQLLAQWH